jgi:pimeloyl-ACP methyl ester carboxylesterase
MPGATPSASTGSFLNSEFAFIPGAGHYAWEDNAEVYLAHILRWIGQAEAARSENR